MTNNPQAFPQHNNIPNYVNASGMTLRDYFAGQFCVALTLGAITNKEYAQYVSKIEPDGNKYTAGASYAMADAMLEARNREGKV